MAQIKPVKEIKKKDITILHYNDGSKIIKYHQHKTIHIDIPIKAIKIKKELIYHE
jgi:hypothetical protein